MCKLGGESDSHNLLLLCLSFQVLLVVQLALAELDILAASVQRPKGELMPSHYQGVHDS